MQCKILTLSEFFADKTLTGGDFDPNDWSVTIYRPAPVNYKTKQELLTHVRQLLTLLPGNLIEDARQTLTDDNRCTRDPIWQVQEEKRVDGLTSETGTFSEWRDWDSGDFCEADPELVTILEQVKELCEQYEYKLECPEYLEATVRSWADKDNPNAVIRLTDELLEHLLKDKPELREQAENHGWAGVWQEVWYDTRYEPVAVFFTEAAADRYIQEKAHKHSGALSTYVDSAMWQPQILMIRELLLALAWAEKLQTVTDQ